MRPRIIAARAGKIHFLGILLILASAFQGCATPRYLPAFGNTKAHCDPVWSIHVPAGVASDYIKADVLKKYASILANNPSLTDKVFPSPGLVDAFGKNSLDLGLGTAAIVSAVQDASPAAAIGSAITAGMKSLTSLRSEDVTQDRQDACMPRDARSMVIITEDAKIFISKDPNTEFGWIRGIELAPETTDSPKTDASA